MGLVINPITVSLFCVVVGFAVYRSTANLTGGIGGVVLSKGKAVAGVV